MDLLGGLIGILFVGLLVGSAARLAVPGPDPMPVWLTIGIGVTGSFVGGLIAAVLGIGPDAADPAAVLSFAILFSILGATIVLILFRRLVQGRPLTGPGAQQVPLRSRGLRRIATRRPHRFLEDTAKTEDGDPIEQLKMLVALRDAGKLEPGEFERRKAALLERI